MAEVHPSLLERKIIHFDMDAFYASVEIRDNPELRGKPVVVGGSPEKRGVVLTASYEARKFGIRSAIPCSRAYRLCPQAIFVRPNFEKYRTSSQAIREIFLRYTPNIEPLSLDEAYLDVTNHELYAVKIAKKIQEDIFAETQLTGSAGIAPNKLLAKIASDLRKPNGLSLILPDQVHEFMRNLPLRKIHGIGPATEKRLGERGFHICSDLWKFSLEELTTQLGENMAAWLYDRSRGIDYRQVSQSRERKSIGKEETFYEDILDQEKLREELLQIAVSLRHSLAKRDLLARTFTVKVKYADFEIVTRSKSLDQATNDEAVLRDTAMELLQKTEAGQRKIRLLGVSASNLQIIPAET